MSNRINYTAETRQSGEFKVHYNASVDGKNSEHTGTYSSKHGYVVFFRCDNYELKNGYREYPARFEVTIDGIQYSEFHSFNPYIGTRSMMLTCAAFLRRILKQIQDATN